MARRTSPLALLSAAGVCVLAAAGCGSTTHVTRTITRTATAATAAVAGTGAGTGAGASTGTGASAGTTPGTATATASSSTTTPAAPSQLAGRSPRQIVNLAARALTHANGYAMRADLTQGHTHTVIAMTTTGPRTFNASIDTGAQDTSVVRIGSATYLRGNRAFWISQAGHSASDRGRAATLANHWISVPSGNRTSVDGLLGTLGPQTLPRCLREDHGRLTIAGHQRIGGREAVVVRDAGNAPGSTPDSIAAAASGPPYPLRYVATGYARRGGRVDVCNTGKGGGAKGTITFDQFGQIATIQRPTGATSAGGATA